MRENTVRNAYLTITNISPDEWCALITEQRQLIGRAEDSEIRVPPRFPNVSRRHAEIWREVQSIKICDVGSKAGTCINGVWVKDAREATLAVGDRIWLGGLELEVISDVSLLAQVLAETFRSVENSPQLDETKIDSVVLTTTVSYVISLLTQSELEIVLWLSRGYLKDEEIGQILHRSPKTIRTHVNNICKKLNVHSRGEVVAWLKRAR